MGDESLFDYHLLNLSHNITKIHNIYSEKNVPILIL